ncbi:MAG: BF3164 family lipoprotein [Gracilimonas sp.]
MNSNILYYLVVGIFLVQTSCINKEFDEPYSLFEYESDINGEPINIEGLQYNTPVDMIIIDSLLIIHDQYNINDTSYFFSVANLRNMELLNYFGKEGRGPDEFLFPSMLSRVPGKPNVLGVNNRRLFSFNEISIENILSNSTKITHSSTNELNTGYSKVIKINDKLFFGTGFFQNGRFGISDSEGDFLYSQSDYPFNERFKEMSMMSLGMAFQSNIATHPDKNILAVATLSSANIDFISFSNDSLELKKSIHLNPPQIENNSTESRLSVHDLPENKRGYEFLTSTSNFVYALYSGVLRSEGLDKYLTGRVVLQFDWEGNAVKQFNLDQPAKLISVDREDEFLYAMSPDSSGENSLLRYHLN